MSYCYSCYNSCECNSNCEYNRNCECSSRTNNCCNCYGANIGSGQSQPIFESKVGNTLNFKGILAGSNRVTVGSTQTNVVIDVVPSNITLSSLSDTNINNPTNSSTLQYQNGKWINGPVISSGSYNMIIDGVNPSTLSPTVFYAYYQQIGNIVQINASIALTISTNSNASDFQFTLPINPTFGNFTSSVQLNGTGILVNSTNSSFHMAIVGSRIGNVKGVVTFQPTNENPAVPALLNFNATYSLV